ncbi:MAG: DUF4392 domain-containing protein [Nitrospinota bacterium]|nr:MAG: DUF4392 domain-containing protein [Nitrospinota bacterium]
MAKVDILVRKARAHGIVTLGIGDGGNEIGMGTIQGALRAWLPWGTKCRCPCGQGIIPCTPTDVLVASTVSNWGAYGTAALIAVLEERADILHSPEMEEQVLKACANAGLIDGGSGYVSGGADALPSAVHRAMITLLGELVHKGIAALKQLQA